MMAFVVEHVTNAIDDQLSKWDVGHHAPRSSARAALFLPTA